MFDYKISFAGLLRFHYVKGTFYSSGLKDGMMVPTVEGQNLRIRYTNGKYFIISKIKN